MTGKVKIKSGYSKIIMLLARRLGKHIERYDVGGLVFRQSCKSIGVNLNHNGMSFVNLFKLLELLDYRLEMTFTLKGRHGDVLKFKTDGVVLEEQKEEE